MANRTLVTGPTEEPLEVEALKAHLHAGDDEDDVLQRFITAVRTHIEHLAGVAFLRQTWELALNEFPVLTDENPFASIPLPGYPLSSVTSIKYVDADGATQTLDSGVYSIDTRSKPGRVVLAYNQHWPSTRWQPNAVIVQYVCGYASAPDIPEDLLQTLFVVCGSLYLYREELNDSAPAAVGLLQQLLTHHRVWAAVA